MGNHRVLRVAMLAVLFGAGHLFAQRPSFRSAVDLILLNVTVTGPGGVYVPDLGADEFAITEDGRPQEVTYFSPATVPLSVALAIDTSSSMDEELPVAQQAAKDFVAKLRPGDLVQIVSFDSRVEIVQTATGDRALLNSAIDRLRAGGATSLYNAVYIILREMIRSRPQSAEDVRRQVIIVLSDGEDTSSLVTFDHLLDSAKRSQTVIYTVGLGLQDALKATRPTGGEFGLRQLSQETGGRLFLPKRSMDLDDVYTQIANELTTQYVLGYLSNNGRSDGAWRRVAIRVQRPHLQARTRTGYYAPTP